MPPFAQLLAHLLPHRKVRPWCAENGISYDNVKKYVGGSRVPNLAEATALADALAISGVDRDGFLAAAAEAKIAQELRSDESLAHFAGLMRELDRARTASAERSDQIVQLRALLGEVATKLPKSEAELAERLRQVLRP